MLKPKVLDLFCGAGGCSVGYARAGFEVVGVDFIAQPNYPYTFIQADALAVLQDPDFIAQFDFIHASPPCQGYSKITPKHIKATKPDLMFPVRDLLVQSGKPFVIENVEGASKAGLRVDLKLSATLFPELRVLRERHFEISQHIRDYVPQPILPKPRGSVKTGELLTCVGYGCPGSGKGQKPSSMVYFRGKLKDHLDKTLFENRALAMGIDWIKIGTAKSKMKELVNAIPPPYTEFIGSKIFNYFLGIKPIPKPQLTFFDYGNI